MKLEDLLSAGHISQNDYETYVLFSHSEMGRKWFENMIIETFMDEPSPQHCIGEAFAYTDGRRSIFRNIKNVIDGINQLIKEMSDDHATTI